jgi:hypothetical protein
MYQTQEIQDIYNNYLKSSYYYNNYNINYNIQSNNGIDNNKGTIEPQNNEPLENMQDSLS